MDVSLRTELEDNRASSNKLLGTAVIEGRMTSIDQYYLGKKEHLP